MLICYGLMAQTFGQNHALRPFKMKKIPSSNSTLLFFNYVILSHNNDI